MPYTGFDPQTPASPYDVSGGGLDPSAYYALSPGGRFPGDVQNVLEWLAAQSRGTAGGNPSYDVPDWLQRLPGSGGNIIRRLLSAHERNVQTGGTGQQPTLPGGQPHTFFSGPGAYYGPPGGELNGVVDIGRPGIWDGPDDPGLGRGVSDTSPAPRQRGGGGGGGGVQMGAFQPTQQLTFKPSFVGWNPIAQGGASIPSSIGPSSLYGSPTPAPKPNPRQGNSGTANGAGSGNTGSGSGRRVGGGGSNRNNPITPSTTPPGAAVSKPLSGPKSSSPADILEWLSGLGDLPGGLTEAAQNRMTGADLRNQQFGGIDVGNLDRGTPGWLFDPTTGIVNTGGFPGATLQAPHDQQSFDSYLTQLHDLGFSNESISTVLGRQGYQQNEDGGWNWNWGAGPVVRGDNGYQFARDASVPRGGGSAGEHSQITSPDPRAWGDVLRR